MSAKNILSSQNPRVKHWVKLRTNKTYRTECQRAVVCGNTLVEEIAQRLKPILRLSSDPAFAADYLVTPDLMKKISGLPAPETLAAEFPLPTETDLSAISPLLALDGIADPGNLGTLVRTALGLGWKGVFLLPGCADLFNEKVIRASRGGVFRLPFMQGNWEKLSSFSHKKRLVADLHGKPLHEIAPHASCILLLSHEGEGVSAQGRAWGSPVTIPLPGEMESLNVASAGAILMHFLRIE